MNPLIQLKAKLQCFVKALRDQTKGNTLIEISKLICCALLLTLVLRSGSGCDNFQWPGTDGSPTPAGLPEASSVQLYNCNHDNAGTGVSARAYNAYTRVDDGPWVERGGLNPQPGDWTDCHDDAHKGASLYLQLTEQIGKWEFRLIKLPLPGEPDCDSSAPDVANACGYLTHLYESVSEGPAVVLDVSE
jgi:hypothetical protein